MGKDREDIYYGECHHIFSDDIESSDCIKRYFEIIPLKGNFKRIIICNEYLRLKVRENAYKWKEDYRKYNTYRCTVEEIISEFIPIGSYFRGCKEDRINPVFDYCICNRPYLTSSISLFDAVKRLYDAHENWEISKYNNSFVERTYFHIHEAARYFTKHNKYKRQKEKIDILLKHLNYWNYDSQTPKRLIEIFELFFEIQIYIESLKR